MVPAGSAARPSRWRVAVLGLMALPWHSSRRENTCSVHPIRLTSSACLQLRLVNFWAPSGLVIGLGTVKHHGCGVGAADPCDPSDLESSDHQACIPAEPCRGLTGLTGRLQHLAHCGHGRCLRDSLQASTPELRKLKTSPRHFRSLVCGGASPTQTLMPSGLCQWDLGAL